MSIIFLPGYQFRVVDTSSSKPMAVTLGQSRLKQNLKSVYIEIKCIYNTQA